jgi:glyoxylase-like metal-dependent hydrolase (beta-lactamase superfamily II)
VAQDLKIVLIDLPVEKLPGFHHFLSSWLIIDESSSRTILIDVGPVSSVPVLVQSIEAVGVSKLDFILLTHVHLDHSGGLGHLLKKFESAKVLAHPKGKKHLLNPKRLWESSVEVLGDVALAYGRPIPAEESSFLPDEASLKGIKKIETPGHASHHYSFLYEADHNVLFVGEAAGTYYKRGFAYPGFDDGTFILRPATPPKFYLDIALSSIEKLKRLKADIMCYAHFGYTNKVVKCLDLEEKQLLLWDALIRNYMSMREGTSIDAEDIITHLLEKDPFLADFPTLPEDIREREKGNMLSSVNGFLDYFSQNA